MQSLFFWRDWPGKEKTLWLTVSGVLIFSIVLMWFSWFRGAEGVIDWQRLQEQKVIETTVHEFRVGPFQLNVPGESYVIFEYLNGSAVEHNRISSYIFLIVLIASSMVLLAVITTLRRFWYYLGMGLFVLFVAGLRLEVLQLFNIRGYEVSIAVVLVFIAVSFYFKSFKSSAGLGTSILTFVGLAVILGITFANFSAVQYPLLHLAVTAYLPGLILSALFILMVAQG